MSLKSIYHRGTSILIAIVLAWNSFGYIGVVIGNALIESLHHSNEYCEIALCYCEVSDGISKCTCHHQDKFNHKSHKSVHCITDLKLSNSVHDEVTVNLDTRNYLKSSLAPSTPIAEHENDWTTGSFSLIENYIPPPLRPPSFV